ncbi:MAG: zinc transporter ZntB [Phycisphaerales bacterium]
MSELEPTAFEPFDEQGGLILAVRLPGSPEQFAQPLTWTDLERRDPAHPLWVHLDRTRPRAKSWLTEHAHLPPIISQALLADETRPRVAEYAEGMLVILRGVNLNPGAEPDELISIRLWVEPDRIITLRQHRFQTVRDLRQRAQRGQAPPTTGAVLAFIALGLASRLNCVVENLQELMDEAEHALSEEDPSRVDVRRLADVRRQAVRLRRYLAPQRDALSQLVLSASPLISPAARHELLEALDRNSRIVEDLEEVRDRAAVSQDEHRAQRELAQSRTMYLLTIVASIFLPLGFITGLLGINVGGIPGQDSPRAFWVVTASACALAAIMLAVFRKLRWI